MSTLRWSKIVYPVKERGKDEVRHGKLAIIKSDDDDDDDAEGESTFGALQLPSMFHLSSELNLDEAVLEC